VTSRAGPPAASVHDAVTARYDGLAGREVNLSCGGALELAAPAPGEVVLDLGCGRGGDLLRALERVGPGGAAVGVDASPGMVEAARGRLAGHRNCLVVQGDLAAAPLPDGLADVVVSSCAINHAPDKPAVFREVRRLLAPGGRLLVSDVVSEEPLPDAVRADPAAWAACYGGAIPEAEYLAAVEAAGLREVRVLRRTAPYPKGGVLVRSLTVEARG
jgi:arsenite methyltransferase